MKFIVMLDLEMLVLGCCDGPYSKGRQVGCNGTVDLVNEESFNTAYAIFNVVNAVNDVFTARQSGRPHASHLSHNLILHGIVNPDGRCAFLALRPLILSDLLFCFHLDCILTVSWSRVGAVVIPF